MPGNEVDVARFLFNNAGRISLNHLGTVQEIGFPGFSKGKYSVCRSEKDLLLLSSDDSHKKADIYVNGRGISIKQKGSQFDFNRLQRAEMEELFRTVGIGDTAGTIGRLEREVDRFHNTPGLPRDRPWKDSFIEEDFYKLLEFLMMKASPNLGTSIHPAELIMEAPSTIYRDTDIDVHTFEEYFQRNIERFRVSVRRCWLGQDSKSEHGRAISLMSKPGNAPFVYSSISGEPRSGWMVDWPKENRRTVHFLMLSKV